MTTYVALLRGINLGSRNKIRMADLRNLFADLGHGNVRSHIQTGNVIFSSPARNATRLGRDIEQRIEQDLGVTATVLVRTGNELSELSAKNPFLDRDVSTLYVTFLAEAPDPERAAKLERPAGEPADLSVIGREVYLHCPDGYGVTKLSNALIEKRQGVAATTRSWKVVTRLAELAAG